MDPDARGNLNPINFPTVGRKIKTPVLIKMRDKSSGIQWSEKSTNSAIRDNSEVHII